MKIYNNILLHIISFTLCVFFLIMLDKWLLHILFYFKEIAHHRKVLDDNYITLNDNYSYTFW